MIELKVQCDCGQKYKFDVEPVEGRMPFTVACPICGADGTEKANALLQSLPRAPVAEIVMAPAATAAPAGLRIRSAAPAAAPAGPPPLAPAPSAMPSPPPTIGAPRTAAPVAAKKTRGPPNFGLGLLGGIIGTLVGTLIYFWIFKYTGLRIKLLAIGVGGLAGWGAELLGRGEGSKELGGLTAVFVLSGIVGAQYLVAMSWWHENVPAALFNSAYSNSVLEAQTVIKAIPTGSDQEIRNYLAREQAGEDGDASVKPNPASITADDVKLFREKALPQYQDLAGGKITEQQFDAVNGIDPLKEQSHDSEEGTAKSIFLLLLLSKANLISLAAAAALAFKMSTNA